MSSLHDIADSVLAKAQGNEQIEVVLARGTDTHVRAYQGAVEELSSASSGGLGIRILVETPGGARVGSASAGSLAIPRRLRALCVAPVPTCASRSEVEYLRLARPDGVAPAILSLLDEAVAATPIETKIALALELEAAVRSADSRIRQVDSARLQRLRIGVSCRVDDGNRRGLRTFRRPPLSRGNCVRRER
jgi:PmbA protein